MSFQRIFAALPLQLLVFFFFFFVAIIFCSVCHPALPPHAGRTGPTAGGGSSFFCREETKKTKRAAECFIPPGADITQRRPARLMASFCCMCVSQPPPPLRLIRGLVTSHESLSDSSGSSLYEREDNCQAEVISRAPNPHVRAHSNVLFFLASSFIFKFN